MNAPENAATSEGIVENNIEATQVCLNLEHNKLKSGKTTLI